MSPLQKNQCQSAQFAYTGHLRYAPIVVKIPTVLRPLVILLLTTSFSQADVGALSSYAKGLFAERDGLGDEARLHFETTLAADPHSFTVAQRTANYQDLPTASKTLRTYANGHPNHLSSQIYYADFLQNSAPGDAIAKKTALTTLESAYQRFPHTSSVFSRLITIHEEDENRDASLKILHTELKAEHSDPYHWVSLIQQTRTLIPADDPTYHDTLNRLHSNARRDGIADPAIARRVADYYRDQGKTQLAIDTLTDHVHTVPNSLDLRTRLGLLLLSSNQEAAGVRMLEDTISIDPDQIYAHRALAKHHEDRGNIDQSLHHEAEVLRAAGGDPTEFIALANRYLEHEQPREARLLLEKARFHHPDNTAIIARLAIATLRDGNTKEAAELFRQAESLAKDAKDPKTKQFLDADFQIEFAHSLQQAGDTKEAENRLREAIRSVPEDQPNKAAYALRELARLWLDQNKNQGPAISLLKRAQKLEPENEETNVLLERAKK